MTDRRGSCSRSSPTRRNWRERRRYKSAAKLSAMHTAKLRRSSWLHRRKHGFQCMHRRLATRHAPPDRQGFRDQQPALLVCRQPLHRGVRLWDREIMRLRRRQLRHTVADGERGRGVGGQEHRQQKHSKINSRSRGEVNPVFRNEGTNPALNVLLQRVFQLKCENNADTASYRFPRCRGLYRSFGGRHALPRRRTVRI